MQHIVTELNHEFYLTEIFFLTQEIFLEVLKYIYRKSIKRNIELHSQSLAKVFIDVFNILQILHLWFPKPSEL